jgi:hypothetical protein
MCTIYRIHPSPDAPPPFSLPTDPAAALGLLLAASFYDLMATPPIPLVALIAHAPETTWASCPPAVCLARCARSPSNSPRIAQSARWPPAANAACCVARPRLAGTLHLGLLIVRHGTHVIRYAYGSDTARPVLGGAVFQLGLGVSPVPVHAFTAVRAGTAS